MHFSLFLQGRTIEGGRVQLLLVSVHDYLCYFLSGIVCGSCFSLTKRHFAILHHICGRGTRMFNSPWQSVEVAIEPREDFF